MKPTPEIRAEIQEFLYREAWLLDTYRLQEWYELLADDIRYWIPTIETVRGSNERFRDDVPYYHLVDWDKRIIGMRLAQMQTGLNHCEIPASVAQRLIANVRVTTGQVVQPSIGPTRTEADFAAHVARTVAAAPAAGYSFIVDQLRWV